MERRYSAHDEDKENSCYDRERQQRGDSLPRRRSAAKAAAQRAIKEDNDDSLLRNPPIAGEVPENNEEMVARAAKRLKMHVPNSTASPSGESLPVGRYADFPASAPPRERNQGSSEGASFPARQVHEKNNDGDMGQKKADTLSAAKKATRQRCSRAMPAPMAQERTAAAQHILVGRTVTIHQRIVRGKRNVPCIPMQIVRVIRRKQRLGVHMKGHGPSGGQLSYVDWVPVQEDLNTRYAFTTSGAITCASPVEFNNCFHDVFRQALPPDLIKGWDDWAGESGPLLSIMPEFRFVKAQPSTFPPFLCWGGSSNASEHQQSRACLQYMLVTSCQIFDEGNHLGQAKQGNIWRASICNGRETWLTSVPEVRREASRLSYIQEVMRTEIFLGKRKLPATMQSAGFVPLWPWQAWLSAEFTHYFRSSECCPRLVSKVNEEHGAQIQGLVKPPFKLAICVAAPGEGKTRLGALCARGIRACALVVKGTVENWRREAQLLGMEATEVQPSSIQTQAAEFNHIMLLTRETLARLDRRAANVLTRLPPFDLLIVDEFHALPARFADMVANWETRLRAEGGPSKEAAILGLTGSFDDDAMGNVAKEMKWDADVVKACAARLPAGARGGAFPRVEMHVHEIAMTDLEMACYRAGCAWMRQEQRQRLLIFPPSGEDAQSAQADAQAEHKYNTKIWESIIGKLQDGANKLAKPFILGVLFGSAVCGFLPEKSAG